jgi:predicted metal-dependent HD superfamily phosphohydrolase
MHPFIAYSLPTLVPLYSAHKRYYHNLDHINFCLGQLEWARKQREFRSFQLQWDWEPLEGGIWYHDPIYNPYAQQESLGYSERESIKLLEYMARSWFNQLHGIHWSLVEAFLNKAKDAVEVTAHHLKYKPDDFSEAQQLMADIDLAALGLPWDAFLRNTENVCKEYEMSDSVVERGRIAEGNAVFLAKMLERPRLYYTEAFYQKYEEQARENIAQRIREVEHEYGNEGYR